MSSSAGTKLQPAFLGLLNVSLRHIVLVCAALPLLLLSACGGTTSSQGASTVPLHIWYSTDDPVESRWATSLVKLFDQTHKRIHASIHVYGFDDFNTKMLLALGSGSPPDLAYATPRTCGIPKYVQNHTLVNLTSVARRLHWANLLRPGLLQDYNSPFTIFATKRFGVQPKNIGVYAVPSAMAGVALMYNATLLRSLHLSVPRTLAALIHDVTVAKKGGLVPLGLGNADGFLGDDWYQTLVNTRLDYQNLERELRIDPNFSFKPPTFHWAASQMYRWSPDFTPNNGALDAQEGVDEFFRGKTLFQLISSSENSQITSDLSSVHFRIGVFGFPGPTAQAGTVMPQSGYEGWIVPSKGHSPSAAVTFINWVLHPSVQSFLLKQGVIPATSVSHIAASRYADSFLRQYLSALAAAHPGVFLDAAPILNLNATMEANVQFLLSRPAVEQPAFLPTALELIYKSHGKTNSPPAQIDCEF